MTVRERLCRASRFAPLPGLLFVGGCLARIERQFEYLLAPDALENTTLLPASNVAALAQLLHHLL
jgi:hypothetical protein